MVLTDQFGHSHELESGSDDGGGDDVVDEEGAVVRKEDTVPLEGVPRPVRPVGPVRRLRRRDHGLQEATKGRQADGGPGMFVMG